MEETLDIDHSRLKPGAGVVHDQQMSMVAHFKAVNLQIPWATRQLGCTYREATMATQNGFQYIRLRNLGPNTSTLVENEVPEDDEDSIMIKDRKPIRHHWRIRVRKLIVPLSLLLNFIVAWKLLFSGTARERILTYSPALVAVENERVVFSSAFGIERSPFQGAPNEENDKLWGGLYDFGITRLTVDEARPMDNKTLPVPDQEGGYVVQLAVFHQLHCLNLIRKGIYGDVDMTNSDDLMGIEHLDHCIDMLRQGIMCSSDVTPITFTRTSLDTSMKVVAEVVHTCRRFSRIQQWAWNRRIGEEIDKDKVITNDPLGWGTYTYTP
ncbi:hypothetical protein G7Y89_g3358 [Cudoniella acicularis]|uniref:Tat pathway signal sequence n=1 Tax=Cudoniella acicularis TaxID=354080 RepID=A0A8H4W596_9HELO|nr:hypothetical protein G7Y89_g3358 [Cudoniella acicularis]